MPRQAAEKASLRTDLYPARQHGCVPTNSTLLGWQAEAEHTPVYGEGKDRGAGVCSEKPPLPMVMVPATGWDRGQHGLVKGGTPGEIGHLGHTHQGALTG